MSTLSVMVLALYSNRLCLLPEDLRLEFSQEQIRENIRRITFIAFLLSALYGLLLFRFRTSAEVAVSAFIAHCIIAVLGVMLIRKQSQQFVPSFCMMSVVVMLMTTLVFVFLSFQGHPLFPPDSSPFTISLVGTLAAFRQWKPYFLYVCLCAILVFFALVYSSPAIPPLVAPSIALGPVIAFFLGWLLDSLMFQSAATAFLNRIRLETNRAALAHEQERSEKLLLSILPTEIAKRIKAGETHIAEHYSDVTVLFADVVGFTKLSACITPQELVLLLDSLFSAFDSFAQQYQLEKIKTIGDAYMVVGGIPVPTSDHCERIALFALEIDAILKEVLKNWSSGQEQLPNFSLQMRIGLHTGEAVAGVIGTHKFSYDLWGDTVNTASRMESNGVAGKIHCSSEVYAVLKDKFLFEERGEIEVKGKGVMRTWFLLSSAQAVR